MDVERIAAARLARAAASTSSRSAAASPTATSGSTATAARTCSASAARTPHLLGIDRRAEHEAATVAASLGVGPEVVAFVEPEGYLVTRFVEGSPVPPEEMQAPGRATRDGRACCGGSTRARASRRGSTRSGSSRPTAPAPSRTASTCRPSYDEREGGRRSDRGGARAAGAEVPCHNDLLNANFIRGPATGSGSSTGSTRGWATASSTSPTSRSTTSFDARERRACSSRRTSARCATADAAHLQLMRFMSDFREAMWGVVQQGISELDFDFAGYAGRHFERLGRTAESRAFTDALAAAGHPTHQPPPTQGRSGG